MHKHVMKSCSNKLMKEADHYEKAGQSAKSKVEKKLDGFKRKEALSASRDLKKRAKKSHGN